MYIQPWLSHPKVLYESQTCHCGCFLFPSLQRSLQLCRRGAAIRGHAPKVAMVCVRARTRAAFQRRASCSQSARFPATTPPAADACMCKAHLRHPSEVNAPCCCVVADMRVIAAAILRGHLAWQG